MDDSESTQEYSRRRALRLGAGLATGTATVAATGGASAQTDAYGGYLSDAEWEGQTVDASGMDELTISVGAGPQGLQFDPTAVYVEPGTAITWEWTGNGGGHNVVNEGGNFESEVTSEEGFTFEQTFEEGGVTQYFCSPHKTLGMKGVVVVGEENVETDLVAIGGGSSGPNLTAIAAGAGAFSVVSLLGIAAYRSLYEEDTGGL